MDLQEHLAGCSTPSNYNHERKRLSAILKLAFFAAGLQYPVTIIPKRREKTAMHKPIRDVEVILEDIRPQELYKWEAIYHFQQHWDLEANDFAAMLSTSLEKTANLLNTQNYFPGGMITGLAEHEPETVRTAFR